MLPHLGEDPGVVGGGAPDHDGVAAGFADHARGVFGLVDVAVADDGNFHRLLDGADEAPVGSAGVTLRARARMDGDAFDADAFGHFRDVNGDDGVFVPAGAQLDSQRNFHGGADRFENF